MRYPLRYSPNAAEPYIIAIATENDKPHMIQMIDSTKASLGVGACASR